MVMEAVYPQPSAQVIIPNWRLMEAESLASAVAQQW